MNTYFIFPITIFPSTLPLSLTLLNFLFFNFFAWVNIRLTSDKVLLEQNNIELTFVSFVSTNYSLEIPQECPEYFIPYPQEDGLWGPCVYPFHFLPPFSLPSLLLPPLPSFASFPP